MGFYSEKTVTARKRHRCDACLKFINPGETYLRVAGVSDGEFWSGAYHPDCREWEVKTNREAYAGNFYDDWVPLHEYVTECDEVLNDAPQSVKDRFNPAGVPA